MLETSSLWAVTNDRDVDNSIASNIGGLSNSLAVANAGDVNNSLASNYAFAMPGGSRSTRNLES